MKSILLLVIALAFSITFIKADIIYNDVIPDDTLKGSLENPWDQHNIDLNSDGNDDFIITHFYPSDDLHYTEFQVVNLKPAEILVDDNDSPKALDFGAEINSEQNKWLQLTSFAIHVRDNWKGAVDKYLGVRLQIANDWIYGWLRLDIPSDESYCILKDFACENILNIGIKAGDKNSTSIHENIKYPDKLTITPNPASDYIEITGINNNPRFKSWVEDIVIYNTLGNSMKNLTNALSASGEGARIDISQLPAGVYFLRMWEGAMALVKE